MDATRRRDGSAPGDPDRDQCRSTDPSSSRSAGANSPSPFRVRVGTDIVDIDGIAASVANFGARYLERVFTPDELVGIDPTSPAGVRSLAGRFAAKESVLKALRPMNHAVPWSAIEITRDRGGAPVVNLYGVAQRLAQETGVVDVTVSISHEGQFAVAVAAAVASPDVSTTGRSEVGI